MVDVSVPVPVSVLKGTVANVVGFPGFMALLPKWTVPLKCLSITAVEKGEIVRRTGFAW